MADSPESEHTDVIDILQTLGEQYVDLGRVDEGLPRYRRAVEIRRRLLAGHPGDRDRTVQLAEQLAMLADVERHGGDPAGAERSFAEAVAVLGPLASAADSAVQVLQGTCLMGEGQVRVRSGVRCEVPADPPTGRRDPGPLRLIRN